jgi:hypothetical protein
MTDFVRDWRCWPRGERVALNVVMGSLVIATMCLAL